MDRQQSTTRDTPRSVVAAAGYPLFRNRYQTGAAFRSGRGIPSVTARSVSVISQPGKAAVIAAAPAPRGKGRGAAPGVNASRSMVASAAARDVTDRPIAVR